MTILFANGTHGSLSPKGETGSAAYVLLKHSTGICCDPGLKCLYKSVDFLRGFSCHL